MLNATPGVDDTTRQAEHADPSLDALVPRSSRRRNLVLIVVALLAVALLWWSPRVMRPALVVEVNAGNGTRYLVPSTGIFSHVGVRADGWSGVEIVGVGDMPGARLVGAWVVSGGVFDDADGVERREGETDLDYVRRLHPGLQLGDSTSLPQRIDDGERARLVTLWDVTSCEQFVASGTDLGAFGPAVDVTLRTPIGTQVVRTLDLAIVVDVELLGCGV